MAKVSTGAAAEALGKDRKTLQRWTRKPGCPLEAGGTVEVEELRAWALAAGLLERTQADGPRTEAERLTAELAPAKPTLKLAPQEPKTALDDLTEDDRDGLKALFDGDGERVLALARRGKLTPELLKLGAAAGRTRRELAEAERRELENRARRGELVPLEEVQRHWRGQIEVVKGHFQALPGKLAPRLIDRTYDQVYAALEGELHGLLEVFAQDVLA